MAGPEDSTCLTVELVAADRTVWSGEATMVIARTTEGDVGVLRGHAPMLSLLTDAVVEINPEEGPVVVATVDGGFLSVANDRVSILSEHALLAEEINVEEAHVELEKARALLQTDEQAEGELRIRRAEARIRAVEKAS
ncbi:F0F1 ATP synthase subunit epsilon [Nocardioides panacihumi]|uniref:ATP synthase epsilon chain n=1 Tax=Nocardioides panacihumi TaxID=400774 RepID=A0ABN2RE09_9ACTN